MLLSRKRINTVDNWYTISHVGSKIDAIAPFIRRAPAYRVADDVKSALDNFDWTLPRCDLVSNKSLMEGLRTFRKDMLLHTNS